MTTEGHFPYFFRLEKADGIVWASLDYNGLQIASSGKSTEEAALHLMANCIREDAPLRGLEMAWVEREIDAIYDRLEIPSPGASRDD